jgi:rod shape-determining protein MreC
MALLDVRLRAGYLFLAVVIAHLVLISAQVNARTGVPILETVTFGAFAEVQRATSLVLNGFRGAWTGYIALRHVRAENEALRQELANARVEVQRQRALADRTRSLETILGLSNSIELQTSAAQIIGAAASPDFRTVTIDKGSVHQLRADMAVLAPTGVVGRVVIAGPRASRVQLLVDRNAAAGALIVRFARARRGGGRGRRPPPARLCIRDPGRGGGRHGRHVWYRRDLPQRFRDWPGGVGR